MDVHAASTVWCLLDADGELVGEGRRPTTAPALTALVHARGPANALLAGPEVGTLTYLVHDAVTAAGAQLLSFNAQPLRMIAASRKKTDRRVAGQRALAPPAGIDLRLPHPLAQRRLTSRIARAACPGSSSSRWRRGAARSRWIRPGCL